MPNVLVDNTGQSTGGLSVVSMTIGSFVVGSGSERLIYLGVSQWAATDRVPSAVFDPTGVNQALTVHDAATVAEGAGTRRETILKLVAPANVTGNIVVSWAGTVDEVVIGADSWINVNQTTPLSAAVKSTGTGGTPSVSIPNASGDVTHDAISADAGGTLSLSGNQTQRWRAFAASNTTEGAGQSAAGTGTNVTSSWTMPNGGIYALVGVAIQQSSGAVVPVQPPMLPNPMRPTAKGIIGRVALALRTMRPPVSTGFPTISASSSAPLPLGGSAAVAVLVQTTSSAALPLSGAIAAAVAVQATSSAALPLAGSVAATVTVSASSSNALPLAGSAAATVLVQAQSSSALPLGGSAAASVLGTASSSQPLPLSGSAAGAVLVQATSTQPLPLGGTITAGSGAIVTSTQPLPLAGAATAAVLVQAVSSVPLPLAGAVSATVLTHVVSSAPLPLSGAAAGAVAIAITSSQPLPLAGIVSAAVIVHAASNQPLPLAGSIVAQVSSAFTGVLVDEPLFTDFDDFTTEIDFDDLRAEIDFDDLETRIIFTAPSGAEMLTLKILRGEVLPITFTLRGAGNAAQDLTGATSIKWNVGKPGALIISNADLAAIAPATNGKVSYTPVPAETAAAGKYDALAIVTYPGVPNPIVRKFPGKIVIESAIA